MGFQLFAILILHPTYTASCVSSPSKTIVISCDFTKTILTVENGRETDPIFPDCFTPVFMHLVAQTLPQCRSLPLSQWAGPNGPPARGLATEHVQTSQLHMLSSVNLG